MEGRKSPEVANLLDKRNRDRRLGDIIADAALVAELIEHPGWGLVQSVTEELSEQALADLDTSLKPLPQEAYVQKHSFRNGMRVTSDVAVTVIAKGQDAQVMIERDAELASESR